MEKRYKMFDATLEALHSAGALKELILVGSWCQHVYKSTIDDPDDIPALITSDIDFLIPRPVRTVKAINIPLVLEKLGFEMVTSHVSGYTKYISRELEVEFLVQEKGRGTDGPFKVEKLHVNAQGLRYLSMLQDHTEEVVYNGIPIRVVLLEAYVLHKFLIGDRRENKDKTEKDLSSAIQLSGYILKHDERFVKARDILKMIHPRWRKDILAAVGSHMPELFDRLLM